MTKLEATEKEKEEDYTSRKKDAQDFLKRLRASREKKWSWRHYRYGKPEEN
jgi:hypothetical protein